MNKNLLTLADCAPASTAEPMIAKADLQESCVCDLTGPLGLSQPTISHHLKKLAEVDLVEKQRRGTWIWYSLNKARWSQIAQLFA
jgi:ArsR family transcriptional regulator